MKDNSRKSRGDQSTNSGRDKKDNDKKTAERIIHDEEFGEEDVELVDSEWADFERFFRYLHTMEKS